MNEETMETTQNTSDPTPCDPTPSQNAEAAEDVCQESEPSDPCSAERSEVDEEDLQEALKDPELSKDSDPTVDPDPGASAQPDTATELERLQNELSALREELAKRDSRLEQMGAEYEEFSTLYPKTPLSEIPDSVWENVKKGIPIAAAFALFEKKRMQSEQNASQSNHNNASRSAGALSPTRSDYFSPAEVRAMSQQEVRENYQKILQSMQKWR